MQGGLGECQLAEYTALAGVSPGRREDWPGGAAAANLLGGAA